MVLIVAHAHTLKGWLTSMATQDDQLLIACNYNSNGGGRARADYA